MHLGPRHSNLSPSSLCAVALICLLHSRPHVTTPTPFSLLTYPKWLFSVYIIRYEFSSLAFKTFVVCFHVPFARGRGPWSHRLLLFFPHICPVSLLPRLQPGPGHCRHLFAGLRLLTGTPILSGQSVLHAVKA